MKAPQIYTKEDFEDVSSAELRDLASFDFERSIIACAQAKFAQWYQSYQTDADKRIAEIEKALESVLNDCKWYRHYAYGEQDMKHAAQCVDDIETTARAALAAKGGE
jgi:hypothetical protein